jgi:hypothetical protein
MELTPQQQSVLTGTLLGDGSLAKHGRFHRLHVKHKGERVALVEFKHQVFRDFVTMPVHLFDQQLGGRAYPCAQFATRTNPVFSEWHGSFYRGRRKSIPDDIDELLTPLAVAVWFMDDGAADYAGVTFQTHNFQWDEVHCLASVLREEFHLAANLRRNRGRWIIYVGARSLPHLRTMIKPYLLPEFAYKLEPRKHRYVASGRAVTP